MPKVLLFKAPRRHAEEKIWLFLAEIWPKKITSRNGCVLLIPVLFRGGGRYLKVYLGEPYDFHVGGRFGILGLWDSVAAKR